MLRKSVSTVAAALMTFGAGAVAAPAPAAAVGVAAGVLTCNVGSGWGFVVGSSRNVRCVYAPQPGVTEIYDGTIAKFGVDIGYLQNATIVWAVVAPTVDTAPGALAGAYGGATGGASFGIGASANVLIGGSNRSISLQPVSVEGDHGFDVAAGIAAMNLHYQS